jgi:hypothetical protein
MPGNHAQRGDLAVPAGAEQAAVAGRRNAQREAVARERLAIAFGCRNQFDIETRFGGHAAATM